MNQLEICGRSIGEIMRGKPYHQLTIEDLQFMSSVICKVEINNLKLMFLRLNKHTRTGSLSFSYTYDVIKAIQSRDKQLLIKQLTSRDWPEVFDNKDLTKEEVSALEQISITETKIVRNAMYAAMKEENNKRPIFSTCDTRREIIKGKKLSVYEDCYKLCIKKAKDVPNYLSNIVPIERGIVKRKSVVQTEVCYFFYDVLEHLFSYEKTGTGTLSMSDDETKLVGETLDLEYRIYRNYRS